jgi:Uma2 family endonuclease
MHSPELGKLVEELGEIWRDEQRRRHAFWAAADEGVKAEFIDGEILYHSPIYGRHWKASSNITRHLLPYVYDRKLGEVAYEKAMIRCTRNDYEPDICFWRAEIAASFQPKQSAFTPPDFIVEILSDSTAERDRGVKFTDYALHGVQEYWIVDTQAATLEQYILNTLHNKYELKVKLEEGMVYAQAIEGFSMDVCFIFE